MGKTKMKSSAVVTPDERAPIFGSGNTPILGEYEGECLDSQITNLNGLDITSEVMKNVFDSEDYATGISNGWYLGFLGHPEDPNCMEFAHACILMKEGYLDSEGRVFGKFHLLDTPVGRIVSTLQAAGVKFGISIRGAGDIVGNSVDPDTFVFRGFDLVAFPAYPNSVPTFTAIAASTKVADRKKYQAVCASVKTNIDTITSVATLETLQGQFAAQSTEHALITKQMEKLGSNEVGEVNLQKIQAMTELYLNAVSDNRRLVKEIESSKKAVASTTIKSNKQVKVIDRIMGAQVDSAINERDHMSVKVTHLEKKLRASQERNLIYKQRVESQAKAIKQKNEILAGLQSDYDETVNGVADLQNRTSNLGEKNRKLRERLQACESLLNEYQVAYANIYARALGVNPESLSITASAKVTDIHAQVAGATNTCNIPARADMVLEPFDIREEDEDDNDSLVTL